jgi:pyridoxine 5-phosphate synthase
MIRLGVNVDHVATVRQARRTDEPDPVAAAVAAEMGGAEQITVHLREDRRHIQDRDLRLLKEVVRSRLNLEMAATDQMVAIATAVNPDQVTLVPEKREELTTEGGLDVRLHSDDLLPVVETLKEEGIEVSLFIDPDPEQLKAAARIGADSVEIHTGHFANQRDEEKRITELERIEGAAIVAYKLKMGVKAGHGLTYNNVFYILGVPHLEELNIGHSIVARSVMVGMEQAVRDMKDIFRQYIPTQI